MTEKTPQPQQCKKPFLETLPKAIKGGNPPKHDTCVIRLQKGHASRQQAQSKVAPDMVLIEEWHVEEIIHCADMAAGVVFMW